MILKEFRELRRDHRTMGMLIGMPVLLLVVFGYAANFTVDNVPFWQPSGPKAQQVAQQVEVIAQAPFEVVEVDPGGDAATAEDLLQRDSVDVAIDTGQQPPVAYIDGSSLFTAQTSIAAFNRLGDQVTVEILFNPELKTSWVMVPAIIRLILTFIGTIITSIGMVKEKQTGTIEATGGHADQTQHRDPRQDPALLSCSPPGHGYGHPSWHGSVRCSVQQQCRCLRHRCRPVPLRGSGPWRIRLDHFARTSVRRFRPPSSSCSPDPAVRFHLPLEAIPWGVRWISYFLP